MKKVAFNLFILFFMFAFTLSVCAQSNEQIERELIGHIKNIQKWSVYGSDYQYDALSKENEIFADKLLKYTKTASTLSYEFGELAKHLSIATAEDGNFRIFSWDTEDGGTMHNFATVYQYRGADGKIRSKIRDLGEGDAGSFVYDVFTLDTKSGKVYLVCTTFIGSTNDHYQAVRLYKIDGDSLDDSVKLIKTKSGLTDSLGFEYNFFSVVNRAERPVKLISFDKKTGTIKIPVVIEDKEFPNGRVTNKFIIYKFNGIYFVKVN